tara:strand:+ start:7252 stop:7824 length:573 start_codon:yes stop_codon:yes gene_type:complete
MFKLVAAIIIYSFCFCQAFAGQASTCAQCHGDKGSAFATLAGQQPAYFIKRVLHFREQGRKGSNDVMANAAVGLSNADIKQLAAYFAKQKPVLGDSKVDRLTEGRNLFLGGNLRYHIPACASCHTPTGAGNNAAGVPRIAGQNPDYIAQQLHAFRRDERHSSHHGAMSGVAKKLTDDEIQVLANFIAGLY